MWGRSLFGLDGFFGNVVCRRTLYSRAPRARKEQLSAVFPGIESRERAVLVKTKLSQLTWHFHDDPDLWTTGGEPMTTAQWSYLRSLAVETGEEVAGNLTKAEASRMIDELRHKARDNN